LMFVWHLLLKCSLELFAERLFLVVHNVICHGFLFVIVFDSPDSDPTANPMSEVNKAE